VTTENTRAKKDKSRNHSGRIHWRWPAHDYVYGRPQ